MTTMQDVAKLANVSVATVSKAFSGHKGVSQKTRDRIYSIAQELDYFPNRSASQLASGKKADTIGVMIANMGDKEMHDEYMIGILNGVFKQSEILGYRVLLLTPNSIEQSNQNYVQYCHSNNLAGLIIHGLDHDDPQLDKLLSSEIPCVFIDNDIYGKKASNISIDNRKATSDGAEILIGLGHKNIVFVSGNPHASVALKRNNGYKDAMLKHNLSPKILSCDFNKDVAYKEVRDYLLINPSTTAIFCASDLMAIGALKACLSLGYNVPDDISIMGFDNLSFTEYIHPKMSTIAQDFFGLGSHSVILLEDIINDKEMQPVNFLEHKIVTRHSISRNRRK